MIAADTNILVRYVLRDDIAQTERATRCLENAFSCGEAVFINRIVLCEFVWVLQQSYRLPKQDIIVILEGLLETEGLVIDAQNEAQEALMSYRAHTIGFSDALIGILNRNAKASPTVTFDRKASALPDFRLL